MITGFDPNLDDVMARTLKRIETGRKYALALKKFDTEPNKDTHADMIEALNDKYYSDREVLGDWKLQHWIKVVEMLMLPESKQLRVHRNETHVLYVQKGRRKGKRAYLTIKPRVRK